MIDIAVSSDAQSCVVSFPGEEGSSGNALIGVPSKYRLIKYIICLIDDEGISLMPVLLKLSSTKEFIGIVISGKLSSFEQPLISNLRRLVRNWIDEGSSLSGVSSKFRISKAGICSNDIEGISLMPVSLKIRRHKDFIGTVISGRLSSFEQPLIYNSRRLLRNWIDEGTSLIAVPLRHNCSISPEISGNLVIFEQPLRERISNLPPIDCGTSLIEVFSKYKYFRFCEIVGHVVTSRHRLIVSSLRTFESRIGKLLRL
jgi:hypothetical protein